MALAIGAFLTGGSWWQHRRVETSVDSGPSRTLTVSRAEKACQDLRTIECSLSIAACPRAPYSGANIVGRIWHGEKAVADCVTVDDRYLADESGVSSRRWYHVTLRDCAVRAAGCPARMLATPIMWCCIDSGCACAPGALRQGAPLGVVHVRGYDVGGVPDRAVLALASSAMLCCLIPARAPAWCAKAACW